MKKKKNKKGIESEMLVWWLIGLVALVILVLAIMGLRGKGAGALEFIKNLFRFKSTGLILSLKNLFLITSYNFLSFIILINSKISLRILSIDKSSKINKFLGTPTLKELKYSKYLYS